MSIPGPEGAVPALDCQCAGEPRDLGLEQGRALGSKIVALHASLRHLDAFRLEQPWWIPYRTFLWLAERQVAKTFEPSLRKADPAGLARLEGIAEGAGLALRSVCLMNAMEAFLSTVRGRTVPGPPGACSAVAVRRAWAKDREPVVAHNFDYVPLAQPFYGLRESRPRKGFRSLEFLVAPQAGAVDGVNEKGLCITLNYSFMVDQSPPAPLISMAIADALAHCATTAEAAERISRRPRWGAGMLMLADASGDLLSLELSNTRAAVRRPDTGVDWLVFTNVCHCAETRAVQVPETAVFSDRVPSPLRGKPVLDWHARRARRLEELVSKRRSLGVEELAAIMADHGPANAPDGTTPCVHTDYWRTTAALQWFPARRCVRVSYNTACAARYVEVGL